MFLCGSGGKDALQIRVTSATECGHWTATLTSEKILFICTIAAPPEALGKLALQLATADTAFVPKGLIRLNDLARPAIGPRVPMVSGDGCDAS